MEYPTENRKLSALVIAFGIVIAFLARASMLVFTTDLEIVDYRHMEGNPVLQKINEGLYGKEVMGLGGFPFSAFSDCEMGYHGEWVTPACERTSVFGELAFFLNAAFWSLFLLALIGFYRQARESKRGARRDKGNGLEKKLS